MPEPLQTSAGAHPATFPLTPIQRGFWTAWRLFPDRPIDTRCMTCEWRADIDVDRFRAALQDLVDATDALRLRFAEVDGAPRQFACADCAAELAFRDFSQEPDPRTSALAWLAERAQEPFDLHDRVFTTALAKCGERRWLWQFNQHHIVTDFTSAGLLIERLSEFYAARGAGAPPDPARHPSFLDHLARNGVSEDAETEVRAGTAPAARLLPQLAANRSPLAASTRMVRRELHLGGARLGRLREAIQPGGKVTDKKLHPRLLDTFLAAAALLVHRLSMEDAVSIGTLSHNRFAEGADRVVGPLIKTLVMPVEVSRARSGEALLKEVSSRRRAAFRSARAASAAVEAPHNVVVNYITHTMPDFAGARTHEITETRVADAIGLDLVITVRAADTEGDVKILFDMNEEVADVVAPDTLGAMFLRCFDALIEPSDRPLSAIPLCGEEEIEEARAAARAAAAAPPPPYATIPEGFLAQARRTPDALAAFEDDRTLSYAELERRTRAVAWALRERGIGKDVVVAAKLPRSLELVVCMLGIMRAGATFFALDGETPDARAAHILAETEAGLMVLADGDAAPPGFPEDRTARLADLEEEGRRRPPSFRRWIPTARCTSCTPPARRAGPRAS